METKIIDLILQGLGFSKNDYSTSTLYKLKESERFNELLQSSDDPEYYFLALRTFVEGYLEGYRKCQSEITTTPKPDEVVKW